MEALKDQTNKTSYEEIDPLFTHNMAVRMSSNKDKYPPFNWTKDLNPLLLVDSLERHLCDLKLLLQGREPVHNKTETISDHLAAIGCDAMMINYKI